jgi:hypothetical protein
MMRREKKGTGRLLTLTDAYGFLTSGEIPGIVWRTGATAVKIGQDSVRKQETPLPTKRHWKEH